MVGATCRSIGLRGAEIVATSAEPDGLDNLAGGGTVVVEAGDLTVLPAFADSYAPSPAARCTCCSTGCRSSRSIRSPPRMRARGRSSTLRCAPQSIAHVTVRAKTACRLAVVSRDQIDSQALLGVAERQTGRLRDHGVSPD
jgi:hypothetical protein